MVAQREPQHMTVEEWRELERTNPDAKYEYIDGQVYLMSGGSLAHSRISSNTLRALEDALASDSCYVYNSDASVRLAESRYTYPDISVSCDPGDQPTTEQLQVQAPRVVVEVLSDSTEGKDQNQESQSLPCMSYHPRVRTNCHKISSCRDPASIWR